MRCLLESIPSEEAWLKTTDGCEHFLRIWNAEKKSAVLLYLHGIEGHSLWFGETAQILAEQGIMVYSLDRRGAGGSKERRGDLLNWKVPVADVAQIISQLKEKHGNIPIFLMANCWSAKIACLVAEEQREASQNLKGLVLCSPAISVKIDLPFSQKLIVAWRFLTNNLKTISIPLTPTHFTNNPDYVSFIEQDPLRLKEATARYFVHGQILGWLAKQAATKIKLPTLILQAGDDDIVDLDGLKIWFQKLQSKDKALKVFPDIKHTLDFDLEPNEYRNILKDWLLAHAGILTPAEDSQS